MGINGKHLWLCEKSFKCLPRNHINVFASIEIVNTKSKIVMHPATIIYRTK